MMIMTTKMMMLIKLRHALISFAPTEHTAAPAADGSRQEHGPMQGVYCCMAWRLPSDHARTADVADNGDDMISVNIIITTTIIVIIVRHHHHHRVAVAVATTTTTTTRSIIVRVFAMGTNRNRYY